MDWSVLVNGEIQKAEYSHTTENLSGDDFDDPSATEGLLVTSAWYHAQASVHQSLFFFLTLIDTWWLDSCYPLQGRVMSKIS